MEMNDIYSENIFISFLIGTIIIILFTIFFEPPCVIVYANDPEKIQKLIYKNKKKKTCHKLKLIKHSC